MVTKLVLGSYNPLCCLLLTEGNWMRLRSHEGLGRSFAAVISSYGDRIWLPVSCAVVVLGAYMGNGRCRLLCARRSCVFHVSHTWASLCNFKSHIHLYMFASTACTGGVQGGPEFKSSATRGDLCRTFDGTLIQPVYTKWHIQRGNEMTTKGLSHYALLSYVDLLILLASPKPSSQRHGS